jgi:DNA repair protein RecO (recombination protein O)
MSVTTDAIVLSLQPHSDKAHVLHAYTRAGGRVNYMVYGLGRKHPIGMYMPFSLVQITASNDPLKPPTIKEVCQRSGLTAKRSNSVSGLTAKRSNSASDLYKQSVRLFIAEVLYHVLRHPMPDEPMFDFLEHAVEMLSESDEPQNFHLAFLAGFAAQLGFGIPEDDEPAHRALLKTPLTRAERQAQLRAMCSYFQEHVETWQTPRSLDILMEVFD